MPDERPMHRGGWVFLLAVIVIGCTVPLLFEDAYLRRPVLNPRYLDTSLSIDERVDDLYSYLTISEKIAFLTQTSPPIPRLPFPGTDKGIPGFFAQNEALHGVMSPAGMTVFPMSAALGATFDPDAIYTMGVYISDEARAAFNKDNRVQAPNWPYWHSHLVYYSPTINMASDPRWGRTPETYGEDPFLTAELVRAYVKGMQGTPKDGTRDLDAPLKVVTTPKHFVANQEEGWTTPEGIWRDRFNLAVKIDEKWLREYYFPPFEAAIVDGKAESIMSAYNAIQVTGRDSTGIACTGNKWLLTDVLRGEWGFQGYVTSDCGAIGTINGGHKNVRTAPEAVAMAINAGLDMECGDAIAKHGMAAYDLGLIEPDALERAVKANLRRWFRLGLFDPVENDPWRNLPPSIIANDTHHALARELAEKSIVLLKNANASGAAILPLNAANISSIAISGPGADDAKFGGYSGWPARPAISPKKGIEAWANANGISFTHVPFTNDSNNAAEVAAAAAADVSIIVCGLGAETEEESRDRLRYELPLYQLDYLNAVLAANPNSIVLVNGGSAIGMASWIDAAAAVLMIWYPGEDGGTAIANILSGAVSPSGRLPMTFYRSLSQLPRFDDYDLSKNRTYMYLASDPLFPFGHGLSYTNFTYSNLGINMTTARDGDTMLVELDVTNIGTVDADEVVQIYVNNTASAYQNRAHLQLKGFKRATIPHGATRHVAIPICAADLKIWNPATRSWVLEHGVYTIMAGASAKDLRLAITISIA
ncbi:MAG: glycoside hydrolase family 3 C-terminal domain-containing protein [Candidatus Sigynarchaeota archaeon]